MKSHPTNPPLNGDMLKWLPLMFIVVRMKMINCGFCSFADFASILVGYRDAIRSIGVGWRNGWTEILEQTFLRVQP